MIDFEIEPTIAKRVKMFHMVADAVMRGEKVAIWGPSPGFRDLRWIKPVRGGDTLSISTTVLDVKASGSRPDRGVVWTEWRATNQHGELVATVKGMGMFGRRPA